MSLAFTTEEQVAVAAVGRACQLTSSVFNKLVKNETLVKGDKSPVTGKQLQLRRQMCAHLVVLVGDFAAQAVISSILYHAFPADPIVGEEDASDLRVESGKEMKDRIVELANEAITADLGLGDNANWGIGPGQAKSDTEILDAIDRGNYEGGSTGREFLLVYRDVRARISVRHVDNRSH